MADLLQSSATQTTNAPSFYTNYLSQIANQGAQAAQGAQFAGATPNQTQAFNLVGANTGNYQSALDTAGQTYNAAGQANIAGSPNPYLANAGTNGLNAASPYLNSATTNVGQAAQGLMNPYISDVVNQIGSLGQQNLNQNLAPGATAGAVGSGQFGSTRGATVLGQVMRDANNQILGQQAGALETGYQNALTAAQNQNQLNAQIGNMAGTLQNQYNNTQVAAGQTAEQAAAADAANKIAAGTGALNTANATSSLALNQENALATLGAQQQAINQNQQMFPLQALGAEAGLLQGAQIPMSTTSTMTPSTLGGIAGLVTMAGGLNQQFPGIGTSISNWLNSNSLGNIANATGVSGTPAYSTSPSGAVDYTGVNGYGSNTNLGGNNPSAYDPTAALSGNQAVGGGRISSGASSAPSAASPWTVGGGLPVSPSTPMLPAAAPYTPQSVGPWSGVQGNTPVNPATLGTTYNAGDGSASAIADAFGSTQGYNPTFAQQPGVTTLTGANNGPTTYSSSSASIPSAPAASPWGNFFTGGVPASTVAPAASPWAIG